MELANRALCVAATLIVLLSPAAAAVPEVHRQLQETQANGNSKSAAKVTDLGGGIIQGGSTQASSAQPRGRQLQAASSAKIITGLSGGATQGEIDTAGGEEWFKFTAEAGKTYQIETRLGSLDDTMIELVDTGVSKYSGRPQSQHIPFQFKALQEDLSFNGDRRQGGPGGERRR
jgi:hypothetical protein